MLKIKDNIDLKELEKYGFVEYKDCYSRSYNSNEITTDINKETRYIVDIDTDWGFFDMRNLGESKRVNDLIKADLVEKVGEIE